jgi:hypothetical protein
MDRPMLVSPFHQPTKRLEEQQNTLALGGKTNSRLCMTHQKQRKENKNPSVWNAVWGCALIVLHDTPHQTAFLTTN